MWLSRRGRGDGGLVERVTLLREFLRRFLGRRVHSRKSPRLRSVLRRKRERLLPVCVCARVSACVENWGARALRTTHDAQKPLQACGVSLTRAAGACEASLARCTPRLLLATAKASRCASTRSSPAFWEKQRALSQIAGAKLAPFLRIFKLSGFFPQALSGFLRFAFHGRARDLFYCPPTHSNERERESFWDRLESRTLVCAFGGRREGDAHFRERHGDPRARSARPPARGSTNQKVQAPRGSTPRTAATTQAF